MSVDDPKSKVQVTIYGEDYVMRGPAPPVYMKRLAQYVDEKMKQLGQANPRLGLNKVAILTALNLADELFRARRESPETEARPDRKPDFKKAKK